MINLLAPNNQEIISLCRLKGAGEGKIEKHIGAIRLWLLFLDILLIASYGAILFFTNWSILSYPGLKLAVGLSALNLVSYFVFSSYAEEKPGETLEVAIFSHSLYFLFLVDYFGGPTGFLFPILYISIIGAFYYKRIWGFVVFSVTALYLITHILVGTNNITEAIIENSAPALSLLISFVGGFATGRQVEKMREANKDLSSVASKATAGRTQEQAVLSAIADGVYAVDMERNTVLFNKAAQELTNWEEKDTLGLKCWTVMKLKNDQDVSVCEKDCPALKVWNTDEPVFRNDTCFVNKKSKKRIQLSSSYAPIKDFQGKTVGALCVFRDITKEKEVERLRNEFVSTASHELRTPITATEGYLSIVRDSGLCKPDEKTVEYVDKARDTLLNMSKLIKNLLAVTKIEEGKLETTITNFSAHDLAKEVVDVFSKSAKGKKISLDLVDSKKLTVKGKKVVGRSLNVRADREMIREVLNNLIENAIKFTEKGSVQVSIDYDEEFATMNVEDSGMGMPADAQKHLFEKFYRVDNTATREVGGTGLGLYITRSIVETFGGRIWVESSQGKGSKFHFTIPLALD